MQNRAWRPWRDKASLSPGLCKELKPYILPVPLPLPSLDLLLTPAPSLLPCMPRSHHQILFLSLLSFLISAPSSS